MASQFDKFSTTTKLFNFIHNLDLDEQFALYKQLVKDDVTAELFKLIIDMSEDEKIQLLNQLGEIPYDEEPLRTVNLDNHESYMRENPRKLSLIAVKCEVDDRSFDSYIIDISAEGAFIESNGRFSAGGKINLAFSLPDYNEVFQINGRIARSGAKGIAVKFIALTPNQKEVIRKFVENNM